MKKLLVTLTVMGIMVGSLATLSSAASRVNSKKISNRYNGSYYYDIGVANVTVKGADVNTFVDIRIRKNGEWNMWKRTQLSGSAVGNTVNCYSRTIQGKGADRIQVDNIDF